MNTVTVKINGMEYNLKGKENEEYLLDLAGYVDGKVREIMTNNRKLSSTAVAVLAGLNIADELFKCDEEAENLIKKRNSLEERHLTLRERIKELREEMEKMANIKDEEINMLRNTIETMEEKVSVVNELNEKVNSLTNELKEIDVLKTEVESLKGQAIYYKEQLEAKEVECEEHKETAATLRNEIIAVKEVMDEEYKKLKSEILLLNSGNDDLRSAIEDSYSKIDILEDEKNILLKDKEKLTKELAEKENELVEKEKEIRESISSEEIDKYKEEIEKLGEHIKIIEDELKHNIRMKEKIKNRSKEMHFQLQNSKFKVLDLEKKLIDVQIELAKEKKYKNPFLK